MKGSILDSFLPIWVNSQYKLHKVIRWSDYVEDGIGKNMVKQSTLQHSFSFSIFSSIAVMLLQPHMRNSLRSNLDEALLHKVFEIHDLGEGLTKNGDVIAPKKTASDDLKEYIAFKEHFSNISKRVFEQLEYAFLLQFALENSNRFPMHARLVMDKIYKVNYYEALTFKALERFEYLFYPLWMKDKHSYLLTWVIRKQLPYYKDYAEKLPGFRQELFTYSLEAWMNNFLKQNKDVPKQEDLNLKVA